MGFRLVPKSVTLNNFEWRNGRVVCVISPNSVTFGDYYVKLVEDTPTHLILFSFACICYLFVFGE